MTNTRSASGPYCFLGCPELSKRPCKAARLGTVRRIEVTTIFVGFHAHVGEEAPERPGIALVEWAAQAADRIVDRPPKTTELRPIKLIQLEGSTNRIEARRSFRHPRRWRAGRKLQLRRFYAGAHLPTSQPPPPLFLLERHRPVPLRPIPS